MVGKEPVLALLGDALQPIVDQLIHAGLDSAGLFRSTDQAALFAIVWTKTFLGGILAEHGEAWSGWFVLRMERDLYSDVREAFTIHDGEVHEICGQTRKKQISEILEDANENWAWLPAFGVEPAEGVEKRIDVIDELLSNSDSPCVQRVLVTNSFLPAGISMENSFIMEVKKATVNTYRLKEGPQSRAWNLAWREGLTGFVELNSQLLDRLIDKERLCWHAAASDERSLKITAALMAFFLAGKDFGETFEHLRQQLQGVVEAVIQEREVAEEKMDMVEFFKEIVIRELENSAFFLHDRTKVPCRNLQTIALLRDERYVYIKREFLEKIMKKNSEVPLRRFVAELSDEGWIKVTEGQRRRKELETVIVVTTVAGDTFRARYIGIRRSFLHM